MLRDARKFLQATVPLFLALLLLCAPASAVELIPLDEVRLLDSPFKAAQDRNLEYIMALDPNRLLAPYLEEAGLEPGAPPYGNWENTGLNGHIGGHYLSALSLGWAATGREDLKQRLDYVLDVLQRAQDVNGDGYLGGIPDGRELWRQVSAGNIQADLFSLNGYWVPWYNLHKIFAGLRDAWVYAESEQAREMLIKLAGWAAALSASLSDGQIQQMLITEHGGMNEIFAEVAAISGEERYLDLARRYSHHRLLDPLLKSEDQLNGLHANTQIPKVIGYERIAQETGDTGLHEASRFFWETVVNERSVAIGGNSVREHFHDKNDFAPMTRDVEGPETCNTYNMLKLTQLLYEASPEQQYVDYYERALYNHILSSQDPETGGLVYFTPMRPQHYRVYSQVHEAMWCCVGSGIENHSKYGAFIYAHDKGDLYINLYIPSRLDWRERGIRLRQENAFPDRSETFLVFETGADVTLKLRYPSWAEAAGAHVTINGSVQPVTTGPGAYITLKREWKPGDTVRLSLPMAPQLEQMPDDSDFYAVLYGPVVLSAPVSPFGDEKLEFLANDSRMGHIAGGPMCPLEQSPMIVADSPDVADRIVRVGDGELQFRFSGLDRNDPLRNLELIPFFRVHRTRYMLYWPYSSPELLAERQAEAARSEQARLALDRLTIDAVAPGEQQPEAEHNFKGSETEAGVNFQRHWRHASDWFEYELSDPGNEARYLRIDYFGADRGRSFTIELNGKTVAEVTLNGEHGPVFLSVDYPIPEDALADAGEGRHSLRFIAAENSVAGGIYGVRLLRDLPGELHDTD